MFCKNNVYNATFQNSQKFTITSGPFTSSITNGASTEQHVSCVLWPEFICPAWAGDGATNSARQSISVQVVGAPPGYGRLLNTRYRLECSRHRLAIVQGARRSDQLQADGWHPHAQRRAREQWRDGIGTRRLHRGRYCRWLVENDFPLRNEGVRLRLVLRRHFELACWQRRKSARRLRFEAPIPILRPGRMPRWALNRGFNPKVAGSSPYLKSSLTATHRSTTFGGVRRANTAGGVVNHVFGDGHIMGLTANAIPKCT